MIDKPRVTLHAHHDTEFFDEVVVKTVPRWKESELSGDEWRVSASVEYRFKGETLFSRSFSSVESAMNYLNWHAVVAREDGKADFDLRERLRRERCGQPGCDKHSTVWYRLKAEYNNDGHKTDLPRDYSPNTVTVIGFCKRHQQRGDCGLEDADSNYEPFDMDAFIKATS